MLSAVIQALKKSVMFLCTPFENRCLIYICLYEFTLWGRDLVSVVRIRESPYYRGLFRKKIYENFVGTLITVRNTSRCPY